MPFSFSSQFLGALVSVVLERELLTVTEKSTIRAVAPRFSPQTKDGSPPERRSTSLRRDHTILYQRDTILDLPRLYQLHSSNLPRPVDYRRHKQPQPCSQNRPQAHGCPRRTECTHGFTRPNHPEAWTPTSCGSRVSWHHRRRRFLWHVW